MVVEFQVREAINSLVALLRVAEDSAVHCWEQEEPFHPGIFPGLILLARLAADRAGEEFRQAVAAAEQIRKLNESCDELRYVTTDRDTFRDGLHELKKEFDHLLQRLTEVTAERDAARQQAEEMQGRHELQSVYSAGQAGRIAGLEGVVESLTAERDRLREQVAELTKKIGGLSRDTIARLSGNSGELPAEPAPEPDQWQVGDELVGEDGTIHTISQVIGGLLWFKNETLGASAQWWLTENGYRLHRKASDLPDIPPFTPQQVAEFAALTEPIDDSVGADGEGQS